MSKISSYSLIHERRFDSNQFCFFDHAKNIDEIITFSSILWSTMTILLILFLFSRTFISVDSNSNASKFKQSNFAYLFSLSFFNVSNIIKLANNLFWSFWSSLISKYHIISSNRLIVRVIVLRNLHFFLLSRRKLTSLFLDRLIVIYLDVTHVRVWVARSRIFKSKSVWNDESSRLQRRIKSDENDIRWVDSCYLNFIMFVDNDLIFMITSWFISMLFMLV